MLSLTHSEMITKHTILFLALMAMVGCATRSPEPRPMAVSIQQKSPVQVNPGLVKEYTVRPHVSPSNPSVMHGESKVFVKLKEPSYHITEHPKVDHPAEGGYLVSELEQDLRQMRNDRVTIQSVLMQLIEQQGHVNGMTAEHAQVITEVEARLVILDEMMKQLSQEILTLKNLDKGETSDEKS